MEKEFNQIMIVFTRIWPMGITDLHTKPGMTARQSCHMRHTHMGT